MLDSSRPLFDIIAIILAGGLGTRLRPIIGDLPKPLAPIAGRPFLAHQIELLRSRGFAEFVLCTGYRHDLIQAYFGDGSDLGVRISYSVEREPLGTGGALRQALATLPAPHSTLPAPRLFLVLNGDTYFDGDFASLVQAHLSAGVMATVALVHKPDAGRYGAVTLDASGRVARFAEKSRAGPGLINAGVYVCSPEIADLLPPKAPLSLELDVFPLLAERRQLFGCALAGYDMDIGTPEGYREFQAWYSTQH